jgi:NAD(P)-dependent dehydrogenase (short-subunit alcohol dehydrogenase family)
MDFDDLFFERGYSVMKAYGRSKLANILYARLLAQKLAGTGVTVNPLHPGTVNTEIWSHAPLWTRPFLAVIRRLAFIPVEEGARHLLSLITSPVLFDTSGEYFEEGRLARPARLARDETVARRLWEVSERLTGLTRSSSSAYGDAPLDVADGAAPSRLHPLS